MLLLLGAKQFALMFRSYTLLPRFVRQDLCRFKVLPKMCTKNVLFGLFAFDECVQNLLCLLLLCRAISISIYHLYRRLIDSVSYNLN